MRHARFRVLLGQCSWEQTMQALDVLALDNLFIGSPARCLLARTADASFHTSMALPKSSFLHNQVNDHTRNDTDYIKQSNNLKIIFFFFIDTKKYEYADSGSYQQT